MRGPGILVRSLSVPAIKSKLTGRTWQYHRQSDRHSKVACWGIIFDLLIMSKHIRDHIGSSKIGFGINHTMINFVGDKKKDLDLVLCTPGNQKLGGKPQTLKSLVAAYARRMKRADFRAKWDAVLETGRAAIEMHLVETAKKSFDPDALDIGEVQPKVSVAEAIKIVQLHGSKAQQRALIEVEPVDEDHMAEVRERLVQKLQKLRDQMMPEMLAEGWSYDEAHDQMVPPGWLKAPAEDDAPNGPAAAD